MLSGPQRGVRLLPPGLSVALAMLGALLLSAYGYRHRLLVAIHDPMQWADEPIARSELLRQVGSDALLGGSVAALAWLVVVLGSIAMPGTLTKVMPEMEAPTIPKATMYQGERRSPR